MAGGSTGHASRRLEPFRRFVLWLAALAVLFVVSFLAGLWLASWL